MDTLAPTSPLNAAPALRVGRGVAAGTRTALSSAWRRRVVRPHVPWAALRALTLASLVPLHLAAGSATLYQRAYVDRIYPHVEAMGVVVGGLTPAAALDKLQAHVDTLGRQPITLRTAGQAGAPVEVSTTLSALGLVPQMQPDQLVARAWQLGRVATPTEWVATQWDLLRHGERLPVGLGLDRERGRGALAELAPGFALEPVNAGLALMATDDGFVLQRSAAQPGVALDVDATLDRLQAALWQGIPTTLEVALAPVAPAVQDADVAQAYDRAAALLSGPLTFAQDESQRWEVPAAELVAALRLVPGAPGTPASLAINEAALRAIVDRVAARADVPMENPILTANGDRLAIRPGRPGHVLDRDAAVRVALSALANGERSVSVVMKEDKPWLAEADLNGARDWANERLALPFTLDYEGRQRTLDARDVAAALAVTDTRTMPKPQPGQRVSVEVRLDPARLRQSLTRTVQALTGLDPSQAPADAALEVRDHHVEIRPERQGIGVDYDSLAATLAQRFNMLDPASRIMSVEIGPRTPRITEAQLVGARDLANRLIGSPVIVRDAFEEWKITPAELEAMLRVIYDNGQPMAYLGRDPLLARVEEIVKSAEGRTGATVVTDASGRPAKVDRLATGAEIWAAAQSSDRTVQLQWATGA